jgi:mRNA interferase MazF
MRPGDIFLATFPFGDSSGMKLRPVLLLTAQLGSIPEILVAYISSVVPDQLLSTDMILDPGRPQFAATSLKKVSVLRLHKLATIHCTSLARYLGNIDSTTKQIVATKLKNLLFNG